MIVCGREISAPVLEWLQAAAPSLSLRKLAAQLCQRLHWNGPGGLPQLSVAVGVLRRLRELKAIALDQMQAPFGPGRRADKAAGAAAKPLVQWNPGSLEQAGTVELVLVGSRWSSSYRLWHQLLDAHHYLGSGPLAGHQLRYLIKGSGGWLGCLAFSAAALQVEARDRWIGWESEVRRENLPYVINNSRLLLLPWVEVENLASHVLGLAMQRVAGDWLERFGYRPVLAETFVDVERYRGGCYRAANWKLVGMTQGRGRQDRNRSAELSKKLVFVHALAEDFRAKLCAPPAVRRLVPKPRAVLPPRPEPADCAEAEFGCGALGDHRLERRLQQI